MPQPVNIPANLQFTTASLNQSSRQVQQALGRITGQASEFQKSLDASTARVFAFGATTTVLQAVNQSFKKLVSTTIEVEKRLVEINSIFQASASEFNQFRNAIFQVAKDTGQAFSTVAEGAAELARQGLSAEETAKRLEAALILTRISGLDAEKSVKSLTAAINGFASAGLTAEQIVNKMVAVDTAFAVSAQDLADGFARAGSTAEDAGVSFDELLGLITAVEQRTARGGAVIGNAFKSIFTRLSRGKTIEELKELGVQIDANQTGIQKLKALSAALEEISDPTVASKIKELAGGVFQINVVSSTLKDLSSDTSIFADAAATAANATNEAFEKNALLNKSLAAQINSLIASLTSFGEKVGQLTIAPLLGNLVTIATNISEFFDKALDPEKGNTFIKGIFKAIGTFISGPGLVLITTAFLKITMLVAKFAKEGFQAVLNIGSAQEKQAKVQAGIVGLLQRDAQLRKLLNSSTATQAQKEQAVIQAIQRENQLLQQQQSLLQNIVGLAARRGVAGYSSSGGFTGKRGKRFASGFQAEEATAMMLGATSGVKAQYGKGTIGGRRFIMNNQEMEITNFGRNGDSAVIPKYAKGFVPNFAKTKKKVEALQPNQLPTIIAPTGSSGIVSYAPKDYPYSFNFRAVTSSDGEMDNLAAYFAKNYDTKKVSDLLKNRAKKDVNKLSRELKFKPEKPSSIGEIKNPKGFEGAVGAVMGSVFDSALSAMFASEQYDGDGGDFDVRKPSAKSLKQMQLLFGQDVLNKKAGKVGKADFSLMGDYKSDAFSKNTKESMFKKVKNELAWMELDKTQQNRKIKSKQNRMRYKGRAAAGYIPNFNAMNKGVPVNQIRAHFDPMGNPFAVTNTRDEPNGLKDAIGRERQGIGMAASGFVPNFVSGAGIQQQYATAFAKSSQNMAKSMNKAAKSTDEAAKGSNDMLAKFLILQTVLSSLSGYFQVVKEQRKQEAESIRSKIAKAKEEVDASNSSILVKLKEKAVIEETYKTQMDLALQTSDSFFELADAADYAVKALMAFSALQMLGGGKLFGKLGKSFKSVGAGMIGMKTRGSLIRNLKADRLMRQRAVARGTANAAGRTATTGIRGAVGRVSAYANQPLTRTLATRAGGAAAGSAAAAGAGALGSRAAVMALSTLSRGIPIVGAAITGVQIGKVVADKFVAPAINKHFDKKMKEMSELQDQQLEELTRRMLAEKKGGAAQEILDAGIEGTQGKLSMYANSETAQSLNKQFQQAQQELADATNFVEVEAAKEKLLKLVELTNEQMEGGMPFDKIRSEIAGLTLSISKMKAEINQLNFENVLAAETAVGAIDVVKSIQNPKLEGVSKSIVDRGLQGEAAFASAQLARQQDADLKEKLRTEQEGLNLNTKEGKARSLEIEQEIDKSAKNLSNSINQAGATFRNNVEAAKKQLADTIKKLAEQQSQAFKQRTEFALSLKNQMVFPQTVIDNIKGLRDAQERGDKNAILKFSQRLAQNQQQSPDIFTGAARSQGFTPAQQEEMTKGLEEIALRKSAQQGNLSDEEYEKFIQETLQARKEQEPDTDKTQKDIDRLTEEIDRTEIRIKEFGLAFDAQKINQGIQQISDALGAFAEGSKSASEILTEFSKINANAENIIKENNKKLTILAEQVASGNLKMKDLESRSKVMAEKLGIE
jgi:TP901 family phage tail tape measure protein